LVFVRYKYRNWSVRSFSRENFKSRLEIQHSNC
jgi:hypothetical protein